MNNAEIILASGSPRRQDILKQMGLRYTVEPQDVDESFAGMTAENEARRLAAKKVQTCIDNRWPVSGRENPLGDWILGADTFIVYKGLFMGKPADRSDARRMLKLLADNTHTVITGLALNIACDIAPRDGKPLMTTAVCRTEVTFAPMSDDEIEWYLDTDEWRDVAAAYRIQEKAAMFISSIQGSWSNVMGLPINTFYGMLRANNFNFRS
ncbi:MAG: Maf family protein [Spirochaetales bacterium]|uniref:dTTP/UTP pyrophosphatase n=1 Tax=Candidatus Thalassospirochaeta sargassi TaxID=3119039 RepID=A0AAJ1IAD1_9SPIO|nr:Maf family protein [Spirochaetales bacterium]